MLLDYLLLPALFLIGLITSYQDFRYGKIKNKWIILGLVWGLGVYILCLIWALITPSYIFKVFLNSAIALIFGYLLWYFNLWSAGDAKLFFIFSLLLPLKYYWKTVLPYFPSFTLLINTFIPILLFLIGQNLFYFLKSISFSKIINFWKSNLSELKINYSTYFKIGLGFLLIFMVFQIIKYEFGNSEISQFGQWQTIVFLLIIIAQKSLRQIFKKTWVLVLAFLGIIFYLVVSGFFFSPEALSKIFLVLKDSIFLMFIFIIVSALLSFFIQEERRKHLPFAIWFLIGVLITILLKGSLLSLFLNPASFF